MLYYLIRAIQFGGLLFALLTRIGAGSRVTTSMQ
jgi:hypothetical protein